ncbi:hypothetical protein [Clostridium grantii]|uniref:Uncharacterized protein n=1 Tax=Clostridium grantii DSM 8605 TaxID=1121316 RepID=A0A1M5QF28_9CLOT|nr:hypothetical protein [Clostridium grantii]SHH12568.1 hypothetical protein SAMN02745207_00046 [Clostridium grantii DSM 8605]
MEEKNLVTLRREFKAEIEKLERNHLRFKRMICVIFNLIIPGLGFLIFGKDFLKGLISFILFFGFIYLHIKYILPNTDFSIAVIYFIPALIIWIISALVVSNLED